jgi:hypothetical protein
MEDTTVSMQVILPFQFNRNKFDFKPFVFIGSLIQGFFMFFIFKLAMDLTAMFFPNHRNKHKSTKYIMKMNRMKSGHTNEQNHTTITSTSRTK